jgi:hypothetical protein
MDVLNKHWYVCICCQLHQHKMAAMSYYSGPFWGSCETMGAAMAMQLKDFLAWYELLDKVIPYVKDEGANLSTFTNGLNKYCLLGSIHVATTLCYHLLWACHV